MPDDSDARLKRFAFQIAVQLPDDRKEALRVLDFTRALVDWEQPAPPELRVIRQS